MDSSDRDSRKKGENESSNIYYDCLSINVLQPKKYLIEVADKTMSSS